MQIKRRKLQDRAQAESGYVRWRTYAPITLFMASHGRGGRAGLLLGSETSKVLTRSKIPVLVCR